MKTLNKFTIVICMLLSSIYMFGTGTASAGSIIAPLQYSITTPNLVTVELHSGVDPWGIIISGSVTNATMTGTTITATFPATLVAGNYYVVVKGWNLLETWSSATVAVGLGGAFTYDFSTAQTQAYDDNLILVATDWSVYQGDVSQDGVIDLADLIPVYNDVKAFVTGNVVTDLDGNLAVNLSDLLDCYNNAVNFVNTKKP